MRYLVKTYVLIQILTFLSHPAKAENNSPVGGGVGAAVTILPPNISEMFKGIVAVPHKMTNYQRVDLLIKSIRAIEDRNLKMSDRYRRKIALAALAAEKATGIDATLMIALARMESDFRSLTLINSRCGLRDANGVVRGCFADCGMTQHHVSGPKSYVVRECRKLTQSPALSFLKSAREVALHVKYCQKQAGRRWHYPLKRCVLNRYNQGPFYFTRAKCLRRYNCSSIRIERNETYWEYSTRKTRCLKKRRRCLSRSAYWKKLSCFEYGARNMIRAKRSCRFCYSITKIPLFYPSPAPSASAEK